MVKVGKFEQLEYQKKKGGLLKRIPQGLLVAGGQSVALPLGATVLVQNRFELFGRGGLAPFNVFLAGHSVEPVEILVTLALPFTASPLNQKLAVLAIQSAEGQGRHMGPSLVRQAKI